MALMPALTGFLVPLIGGWPAVNPGSIITTIWLIVCWTLCYCVEFTGARWLKSRCAARYRPPVVGYAVVLLLAGVPFVVLHPGILAWAPAYVVLAAIAAYAAWRRRERTLWANAAAVVASCLMVDLTLFYTTDAPTGIPTISLHGMVLFQCYAAVQFGSVLFVKTMIRERGRREYLAASWVWHFGMLASWGYGGTQALAAAGLQTQRGGLQAALLIALAALLLARAVALPLIARRRPVPPMITGMVESVASLVTFVCLIAVGAL